MKKLKLILTALALGILFLAGYLYKESLKTTGSGEVTIIIVNDEKQEIINEVIHFDEDESLEKLLKRNYEVVVENKMLLGIEGIYADTKQYFLKIYINCNVASYGISDIKLNDGDEIRIIYTKVGDFSDPC